MSGKFDMVIDICVPGGPDVGDTVIVVVPRELKSLTATTLCNIGKKSKATNPSMTELFTNALICF
jgi:hypothetical protein